MQQDLHSNLPTHGGAAVPSAQPVGASIESIFTGDNSGQVAVGSNIVQWTVHGDYIEVAEEPARPRPRSTPVSVLPKPMRSFLDRESESAAAVRALESAMSVELCGEAGQGKTALLRHLAHTAKGDFCRDGIVYLDDRDETVDDLLQYLYDAFFEYEIPYKPNEAEVRLALADRCALVLVDEVALADEDVERLTNAVPKSTLVFAGTASRIAGEVETVVLPGLPFAEALLLMQSALGRMLEPDELQGARELWESTEGNPGQILKAAKSARVEGTRLTAPPADAHAYDAIATRSLGTLEENQRRVLATMRELGRTWMAAEHIGGIAGIDDVLPVLESLVDRELVEERDGTFRLVADLASGALAPLGDVATRDRAVAYFASVIRADAARRSGDRGVGRRTGNGDGSTASRAFVEGSSMLRGGRDAAAVMLAAGWALGSARIEDALPLVAWADGKLAVSGRWGARERLLERTLDASRHAGDRRTEAWALHQSGSRALELGKTERAKELLGRSLRMREDLGDEEGASVTRHNLELISPPPMPVDRRGMRTAFIIVGIALIALIALLLLPDRQIASPVALSADRTPDDSTIVQVSWEDRADNEEGFEIERATNDGGFRQVGVAPAGQTFYTDRNVDAAVMHVYRVRAVNDEAVSGWSNLDTVASMAVLAPMEPPAGLPNLVIDTTMIDFGTVAVDSTAMRSIVIRNTGPVPMMVVITPPEPPFALADQVTTMQLEPASQQTTTLLFAPADADRRTGTLMVDAPDDTLPPMVIRLIGRGMGAATSARFSSVLFERPMVPSGARARLEVRFTGAVEEETTLRLQSAERGVVVPPTLTIEPGSDRASVIVALPEVSAQRTIRVSATHDAMTKTASVVVAPRSVGLKEIRFAERSVTGGSATKGTVRLDAPAPRGGYNVLLRSSSKVVRVPDSVRVPEGASSAGFTVTTTAVRAPEPATITASARTKQVSAPLTVLPRSTPPPDSPALFRLTLKPASSVLDVFGSRGKSTATVGISRGVRSGVTVRLESSDRQLVSLPPTVTIPPGATSVEFGFDVRAPKSSTTITMTARVVAPITATTSATVTLRPQEVIIR